MKNKDLLKKSVKRAYKEGKSASTIFEELQSRFPNKNNLFETICNYPEVSLRKRFIWAQYLLMSLVGGFVLWGILMKQGFVSVLIFGFLLYKLYEWNLKSYLYLYVLNGFGLVAFLFLFFYHELTLNTEASIFIAYFLLSTGLAIYLDLKLNPKHKKEKVLADNPRGEKSFRYAYTFNSVSP